MSRKSIKYKYFTGDVKTINRPNVNSILHLFGGWLFEASFIGNEDLLPNNSSTNQGKNQDNSEKSLDVPAALSRGKFELGKAEALGALCRIFCHKKTNEDISPLYLARFYLALQKGLIHGAGKISDTLAMIFVNSGNIFKSNLEGVNIILPQFVAALESILTSNSIGGKNEKPVFHHVSHGEVRRSAIQILLSILPLPHHFKAMKKIDGNPLTVDFLELQGRIHRILYNALQVESDPINTQSLLGGLSLSIQEAENEQGF